MLLNLSKYIFKNPKKKKNPHQKEQIYAIVMPLEGSIKLFEAIRVFSCNHSTFQEVTVQMEEGSILFIILFMDANGCEIKSSHLNQQVLWRGHFLIERLICSPEKELISSY